jgi:predicted PurR-regulated permease PerM
VLLVVAVLGAVSWRLAGVAEGWMGDASGTFARVEERLHALRGPVTRVSQTTERVERLADLDGSAPSRRHVVVDAPSLASAVWTSTTATAAGLAVALVFCWFLLAGGDQLLRSVVLSLPGFGARRRFVVAEQRLQRDLGRYLLTITAANAGLAAVMALAAWLVGMPNPVACGVLLGLLNFAPYLGPAVAVGALGFLALAEMDTVTGALLVPLVALTLTGLEGQVLTPLVLGRRLMLRPVFVFTGVVCWYWLWGVPGALLAVPLLVCVKLACEQVPALRPAARLLGRPEREARPRTASRARRPRRPAPRGAPRAHAPGRRARDGAVRS